MTTADAIAELRAMMAGEERIYRDALKTSPGPVRAAVEKLSERRLNAIAKALDCLTRSREP